MNRAEKGLSKLIQEIALLRQQKEVLEQRCTEAEDALDAIRTGSVDALVIHTDEGEKVFTIQGAEHAYRVLVEQMNEGAATLAEDGTILYCNVRFAEMLQSPLEEIIGTFIYQFILPEYQERFSALLKQGLTKNCRNEIIFQNKNGLPIPVMASINRFDAVNGRGLCLVASDLTERKKIEEMSRLEADQAVTFAEMSRSLVEAGMDTQAIMRITAQSAVQLVGDLCFLHMLSPNRKSLEFSAQSSIVEDDKNEEPSAGFTFRADKGILAKVLRTGEPVLLPSLEIDFSSWGTRSEYQFLKRFVGAASLMVIPITTADQAIGTLMLVRLNSDRPYTQKDLSLGQRIASQMILTLINAQLYKDLQDALKNEQNMRLQLIQAEKLAAMSRMMASIVHEINNPMQSIKNWIYLAKSATAEETPTANYLNLLSIETERISKLVSNMRVFYRPPNKELMQPINLHSILNDVRVLMDIHLDHKKIRWNQAYSAEPVWITGITNEIKQVFLNICLNAVEAMASSGGDITVSTSLNLKKDEIVVSVKNTGPGIKPEVLERIFEPFFTTKENGTGLGLAICYEIIQRHGGHIDVESEMGKGTTFFVRFPYRLEPQPESAA